MTAYEDSRTSLLYLLTRTRIIVPRITSDMGHQHLHILAHKLSEKGEHAPHHTTINVAIDSAQRFERRQPVGKLHGAYVSRVPQLVDIGKELFQTPVEHPVRIGQ